MSIYTKTGDKGTTSLFGGKRVLKADIQIEAVGTIDELTSIIGLLHSKQKGTEKNLLLHIQEDLYQIMGVVGGAASDISSLGERIILFEKEIDSLEKKLPKLTRFILPGGTELAALTHIARTICRKTERRVVSFFEYGTPGTNLVTQKSIILQYLNRLSDFFFILARFNAKGKEIST